MSLAVSYANVAAKGSEPTTNESTASPDLEQIEKVASTSTSTEAEAVVSTEGESSSTSQSTTEGLADEGASESNSGSSPTASSAGASASSPAAGESKSKKSLAPAPVPAKSAWGASSSSSSSTTSTSASVDENKWPTPDKVSVSGPTSVHPQKFIKPITNKWVPINAKVVLPSPKSAAKVQNRNRKNKKTQPKKVGGAISKKKTDEEEAQASAGTSANAVPASSAAGSATEGSSAPAVTSTDSNGSSSGGKGFRKFNGSANGSAPFVPRFTPQQGQVNGQINAQQVQGNGQNGQFFHPQPFNPNYYNQNRQFRPRVQQGQGQGQNGFRPHHQQQHQQRNFRPNGQGYPMDPSANGVFIPQVQIPPPISPKQDPQQALIQQIDYYFSLENLIRDIYLRKNMLEDGGWVPLSLILEFKRVKIIINGIQNSSEEGVDSSAIILDSVSKCGNLDVRYINGKSQEDSKIEDVELRVKDNYEQWLLPQQ
ncbi:hypothetical protein CLIB1423_33S00760 [[Candida] railenensis]|uniref:HTH La-type RNA-binding domain-containing protein n=1 Tax=[Candida] railenensis TaxID=45579 RepID=A0A9P0QVJ4_9ASCO|nr:hypothetical protein CLIB1423_33S00760 [[Candida] railenensis]